MSTILNVIAIIVLIAGALMWMASTLRHRRHLSQCLQDLQRHQRLGRRLIGCVTEMEHILDGLTRQKPNGLAVPEELVGHARYLFGLRQEAGDNAANLARHAVRLRWPDAYLSRATLAGRRCDFAHGALVTAFEALADATREYERGLGMALLKAGNGVEARALTQPVRLLDETAALEVARWREICGRGIANAAEACNLRYETIAIFETKWPVRRSELAEASNDHYRGEAQPMGWQGLGAQPLLHVDAK